MSKAWIVVGAVVAGIVVGAIALVKFGPEVDRVEVGAKAPDFRAIDLATGDSVSFREHYKGAVTLVNIWATWCLPCRVEMPAMERVYRELAPRGFKIAAVSIDEGSPDDVRAFGQKLDLSFDLLQDRGRCLVAGGLDPEDPLSHCWPAHGGWTSTAWSRPEGAPPALGSPESPSRGRR